MHFLLTTLGSLGDLHPYIAVGSGLRERGHTVTIATSEIYRGKVEGEGLQFHSLRPDVSSIINSPEILRRSLHPRTGTEYVFRRLFLPWIEASYEDTVEAARNADLLVGHSIAFATPIVAEYLRKPWLSIALQPAVFLSASDPPVLPGVPLMRPFHSVGPPFWRLFFRIAKAVSRRWGAPVNALRRKLGLQEVRNPVSDDMFSPYGTQAWFSKIFARAQKDWPERTVITGFPFYDQLEPGQGLSTEISAFLQAGAPPVVFTLGSSAVLDAGAFYTESLKAARKAGCRAVLLVGRDPRNAPPDAVPDTVFVAEYEPYSELFPRAAAVVHQGGIGTTAQALRAGRPMIVVPYSHDQPDNANRIQRLGAARVIGRARYRGDVVSRELKALLGDPSYEVRAAEAAAAIQREDGVRTACDGLEAALHQS